MREIFTQDIMEAVRDLCIEANVSLGSDVVQAITTARGTEEAPGGQAVLDDLLENARIAREERIPICQDTGLAVFFVTLGQEVHVSGGGLKQAIEEGVRRGYAEGFLRKSTCHPFTRANYGTNLPAIIHYEIVPGDALRITIAPKGGGSENMSRVTMLTPSVGRQGVMDYVINRVREAGPNPCPPIVVGVGIGGTFEKAALIAKQALLKPLGQRSEDPEAAALEEELLTEINKLGIGPAGLGGTTTALDVHVNIMPCHIASLPVAVNIQCHAARHLSRDL